MEAVCSQARSSQPTCKSRDHFRCLAGLGMQRDPRSSWINARKQIDLPDKHQVREIPRPRNEVEVGIITHICLLLLLRWKMRLDGSLASPTTSFLC